MDEIKKHIINEPQPDYEKAEMDLLRDALKKDHTGRFDMMTTLMKINLMLRKAKISHKPFKSDRR
jgi:hypothetical protein